LNFFKPMLLKTTITFIFIFSFVPLGGNIFKNNKFWTGYPTVLYFMSMQIIHKNKMLFLRKINKLQAAIIGPVKNFHKKFVSFPISFFYSAIYLVQSRTNIHQHLSEIHLHVSFLTTCQTVYVLDYFLFCFMCNYNVNAYSK
jgi:hypothetical protein